MDRWLLLGAGNHSVRIRRIGRVVSATLHPWSGYCCCRVGSQAPGQVSHSHCQPRVDTSSHRESGVLLAAQGRKSRSPCTLIAQTNANSWPHGYYAIGRGSQSLASNCDCAFATAGTVKGREIGVLNSSRANRFRSGRRQSVAVFRS
jgi:hypothetical protein